MAKFITQCVLLLAFLVLFAVDGAKTPPGIAKNPSHATCKDKNYKECYNLEHVCPKFCPDSCTVECASCKPICGASTTPPPDSEPTPSPPTTPSTPTPTPSPPTTPSTPTPTPPTPSPPTTPTPPTPSPPTTPSTPTPTPPTPSPPTTPSTPTPTPSPPTTPSTPTPTPPTPSPTTPSTPTPTPPTPSPSPPPTTPSTPTPSSPTPTPLTPSPSPPTPSTPTPQSDTPSSPTPTPPTPSPSTPPTSTLTPPSPPDQSAAASETRARCKNKSYTQCYNVQHVCPTSCPNSCEVDCVTCKPVCNCDKPGAVCQDPRFIGGDGITFYFHGKKDQDFCLVTDSNLHINAHFIGKRNKNMKRDFTWVQSIGILFNNHTLFISAKKTATWDDTIDHLHLAFDDESIYVPEYEGVAWKLNTVPKVSITRSNTNNVIIEVDGIFKITAKVVPITKQESLVHNYGITEEDCFAHLDLGFKFYALSDQVTGVLGQTYKHDYVSRVNMGAVMPVLGGDKEFATSSLFATDCAVSQFKGSDIADNAASLLSLELPSLSCSSGINGNGVICKK